MQTIKKSTKKQCKRTRRSGDIDHLTNEEGKKGGREGGRKEGRKEGREEGREGGRKGLLFNTTPLLTIQSSHDLRSSYVKVL